jgi:hypothetical protein
MPAPFATQIESTSETLTGPWRGPRQMLAKQEYDSHASIHDDATAKKLGFKGGTIEGPTHFSQFVPLGVAAWGTRFLETGCISAHYRNPVFEGERVRAALVNPFASTPIATIWMQREDGTEILRGTASIGTDAGPTALEERMKELAAPTDLVILRDIKVGLRSERKAIQMGADQHMGALYPFTLADKLKVITEPSPWYSMPDASSSPWGRAIIPIEMISVLIGYSSGARGFPIRGPVVGLFADQEIRLIKGPLFVGEPYELDAEVVALSASRRTESMWVRSRIYRPGSSDVLATMLLNSAYLKDSYAPYEAERKQAERTRGDAS